jgi:type IV secretion system protein VirB10
MRSFTALFLTLALSASAQTTAPQKNADSPEAKPASGGKSITIPAGTQVLLQLKSPIDTKSARVGDGVYCQTSFPVTIDNVMVIPAGTYVKGEIARVLRAGRIKGRAQILFHFNTMIFPNGYTVDLPGALKSEPGATNSTISDDEGTVKANSQKGKDAGTIAGAGATGAVIGAVATGTPKGAGIGGLAGAAVGIGEVLFTRGQDVRIDQGTSLEMTLQRELTVEVAPGVPTQAETQIIPRPPSGNRLPVPAAPPKPQ